MFGATPPPQDEQTPFWPRSPYGAAKVYAYWMTRNYREAYGLFAVNGILFNHESPRRGETFVTRKIAMAAAAIAAGKQEYSLFRQSRRRAGLGLRQGICRGHVADAAGGYPADYVLATGEPYSVRDFLRFCFEAVDLDYDKYVRFDPRYLRPSEVDALVGDASKAERELGWKPSVLTPDLARLMTEDEVTVLA